jgi:hypothetical protein
MAQQTVTTNTGRVFIQRKTGLLSCCPEYLGCVGFSGTSQSRGDSLKITCLSDVDNSYDIVEKIPGFLSDVTFDLNAYLGINGESSLRTLFREGVDATIHVHFGICTDPQDFLQFNKALILDGVTFNSYSTDDLISLTSDGLAVVTETVGAVADEMYEYLVTKNFEIVDNVVGTDTIELQMLADTACLIGCDAESCGDNVYSIPQDGTLVGAFSNRSTIYTVADDGVIQACTLNSSGTLVCSTVKQVTLDVGEDVISAAYYDNTIIVGTDFGKVIFINVRTGEEHVSLQLAPTDDVIDIQANKYGYLVSDELNNIYFGTLDELWSSATNVGDTISTTLLYGPTSWLVSLTSGTMLYTNDSGDTYSTKLYPSVAGSYITSFDRSGDSIIHAISDQYYYQSFDGGCTFQTINLSRYFSELFSIVVCPTDPFTVYMAGISASGLNTYIIKINFAA